MPPDELKRAIIRVGDGRGFIVGEYVITAAHCLPTIPPAHRASYTKERTYADLLSELGSESHVWAECVFVNPVDDLAVLESPDNQALFQQAEEYEALLERCGGFALAETQPTYTRRTGWLLGLSGEWYPCTLDYRVRALLSGEAPIAFGMSGSPIVDDEGRAIGVVSTSGGIAGTELPNGNHPELATSLPGWLLKSMMADA